MKNKIAALTLLAVVSAIPVIAQTTNAPAAPKNGEVVINGVAGYQDTPMLPGGKWHVHDPARPQPAIVTPGTFSSQEVPGKPPSDAIVLFDGTDLSQWHHAGDRPAHWKIEDGVIIEGKNDLVTKLEFTNIQLHVEFATPTVVVGSGQGRGNSGVFLMGKFELQTLDSYDNPTYPDGQAGALYGQHPPLVNASLPPGQWQVYDVVFTAPVFEADGKLKAPAYMTVFHNGVLVQNHQAYLGPSGHRFLAHYSTPLPAGGPISLQDHGNLTRFRNIWVRPLQLPDEQGN
jgi:hypothetical protein